MPEPVAESPCRRVPRRWRSITAAAGVVALSFLIAPAALSYDPEAWLVWGREASTGRLDVNAGPAIKPLPIAWNALAVAIGGAELAWSIWAVLGRAAIVLAVVLGVAATRSASQAGGSARLWPSAAGAAAVVATPTLLEGALAGGSEAMVAAALLGACLLGSTGRLVAAAAVLLVAALLRPEALVLAGAVGVRWIRQGRPSLRPTVGLVLLGIASAAAWAGMQWAGGGSLASGSAAATALREGQPGLAARPALSTMAAAAFAVPWLVAAGAAAWWSRRRETPRQTPGQAVPPLVRWTLWLGGLWVVTVALLAEVGFSGELRYLAPGLCLLTVGVVASAAGPTGPRRWPRPDPAERADAPDPGQGASPEARARTRPGAQALRAFVAFTVVLAALAQAAPAIRDQRALARSQAHLSALLNRSDVGPAATTCSSLAVPRFLRPAVAWRLERPIGSLQSPGLSGTECALERGGRGAQEASRPGGQNRFRRATSGPWSWWR